MGAATSPATVVTGAAAAVQQPRQAIPGQLQHLTMFVSTTLNFIRLGKRARHWLPVILFAVLVGAQTVARTGSFGGFVESTKPARWTSQIFTTADGYVLFWDGTPVNGDAMSFLALTRFLQGQEGLGGTGIYDRRAGYAYVGALASLLLGHYRSFVVLNALAWLGAALAMYWLGGRLLGSRLAAWTAGTLTATGQGFSFMVGTPVSTLWGFASVAMVLAFVEWSGLLQPPFRWRDWLHTGWLIAAVSLFYPVYLALLAFIWLYGLRRAPFARLLGLSALALALTQAWPLIGSTVVGLNFDTTNSAQLAEALNSWWSALLHGLRDFLKTLRTVASAGNTYAAFPGTMLLAAAYGYIVSGQRVRYWSLALCLATLVSALLFTILFPIPRTAFFAYPAIYLLAAAGLAHVAQVTRQVCTILVPSELCGPGGQMTATWLPRGMLPAIIVILSLLLLIGPSLAALVGYGDFDVSFHFWTPRWAIAADG